MNAETGADIEEFPIELKKKYPNLQRVRVIGQGAFGTVVLYESKA